MSSSATPWRRRPSRAPPRSWLVISSLKRDTTMPKRRPRPLSSPSNARPMPPPYALVRLFVAARLAVVTFETEQVAHLLLLGTQIALRLVGRRHLQRNAFDDLQAETLDASSLAGIVRQQAQLAQTEIDQDLGAKPVIAGVRREPQMDVRLDRVESLILEVVGLQLRDEPDPAPFVVANVDHHAAAIL